MLGGLQRPVQRPTSLPAVSHVVIVSNNRSPAAGLARQLGPLLPIVLAGLAIELLLIFVSIQVARHLDPPPHGLTHLMAAGTAAVGLATIWRLTPALWAIGLNGWPSALALGTLALVGRVQTLLALGERHLPEVLETLEPLEPALGRPEEGLLCEAVYECMPHASISRELLERGDPLAVVQVPEAIVTERGDLLAS